MMPREKHAQRMKLAAEQNHRCCYCGLSFVYNDSLHPLAPTIEHVTRLSDGGLRVWENEVAACWSCNNYRGEVDAFAYFYVVQERIKSGSPMPFRTTRTNLLKRKLLVPIVTHLTESRIDYFCLVYGGRITTESTNIKPLIDYRAAPKRQEQFCRVGHSVQFKLPKGVVMVAGIPAVAVGARLSGERKLKRKKTYIKD